MFSCTSLRFIYFFLFVLRAVKLYAILRVWLLFEASCLPSIHLTRNELFAQTRKILFLLFLFFFKKSSPFSSCLASSRIETRENLYRAALRWFCLIRIEVIFIFQRYQFDDTNSRILHFLSRVMLLHGITFHPSVLFLSSQAFHPHYFICAATRYHSKISAGTWSFQLRVYYRVCFRSWNSKPLARWEKF